MSEKGPTNPAPQATACPTCQGSKLVEVSSRPVGGKVKVRCGSCGEIFEMVQATKRQLLG